MRGGSLLRIPLAVALLIPALLAFGAGTARAQCGEEERGESAFQRPGVLLVALCGPKQQAAVMRLDRAGALDTSFAGDGTLGPWPSNNPPHLAVTEGGKFLVQMRLGLERKRSRLVLRRFTTDGTLDRSFAGGNAKVPTNPQHSSPAGLIRVFSQPGGTSVVAYYGGDDGCFGNDCSESTNFIRLFRYSATGEQIAAASYYTEYWDLEGIAMAPDGGLIVTGSATEYETGTYLWTKPDLAARLHRNFAEEAGPSGVVAPGPGGTVLAAGTGAITRYLHGGAVDAGFGEDGSVECGTGHSYLSVLESLGAAGLLAAGGGDGCELVEYRPDGSLNQGFGSGGSVDLKALGLIPPRYRLESVAVGPAGELAVVYGNEDEPVMRIVRFTSAGRLDTGFGKGGVVTLRRFAPA
jgi:uncharacterized delta-60 repeat protein